MRLAARARWGSLSAGLDILAAIGGGVPTSNGREGKGMGKGKEGDGKEEGRKGRGGDRGREGEGRLASHTILGPVAST